MWAHTDAGLLRGINVNTLRQGSVEQERSYLAAAVGQGVVYKAGQLKGRRAGRESEGLIVPRKAAINRWRERALLWSRLDEGKCEGMPEMANNPEGKSMRTSTQAIGERQVECIRARDTRKIIGKPCAANPHARFERGPQETGTLVVTGA